MTVKNWESTQKLDGVCQKGRAADLKELPMAKSGAIWARK